VFFYHPPDLVVGVGVCVCVCVFWGGGGVLYTSN